MISRAKIKSTLGLLSVENQEEIDHDGNEALSVSENVDWGHFRDEYPTIKLLIKRVGKRVGNN